MKFIAIANQKGGVGKTTTSVNLGASLAERGVRVLILDLDPQANSTSSFGYRPGEHESVYSALMGESNIADLVLETAYDNLTLIPSEE
ncbi:MAG: AAA family ATPase, partial [Verrucomicrobiales bacterium]|nr:AAA family ATPase [Verrucomicrobiales bacterium]